MGAVLGQFQWDWAGAEREFQRAIELRPGDALFHHTYNTRCLAPLARTREAVVEERRALELDPLSLTVNRGLGEALLWARRYEEAIAQFRHILEMVPGHNLVRGLLAAVYASNDMPEEALRERQDIFRRTGREREAQELEAAFAEGGETGTLRWLIQRGLRSAEKARREGTGGDRAFNLAVLYARLGEADEAFKWLEEALRQRAGFVIYVTVHPWFDSLRSDPRYGEILKTMNLAD